MHRRSRDTVNLVLIMYSPTEHSPTPHQWLTADFEQDFAVEKYKF